MKLFSETTADTFHMAHNLSTLTSPFSKSRYHPFSEPKNKSLSNNKGGSFIFNTFSEDDQNESSNKNHISDSAPYTINPKVMEVWLNDVLVDAKHLELRS